MESTARLQGKIALVTGASRGLGRHIAVSLASAGAVVAVNYANSQQDAEETVRMITVSGGKAQAFRADVTSEKEVLELVQQSEQYFGIGIDVLVNNATGPQPMLSIEDSTWQTYLDQLDFFVKTPLLLAKAILPGMKLRGTGSIIHIGSEVVQIGNANFSSYVTAKAAMVGMTRSWASELGPQGIRVNLVAPGWIPVERHEGAETGDYQAGVPLQRMGEPTDIANAVVFFASDESRFITGQCLSVNGGNTFGS
ncbi:3-oxoacyl-ACP reductase [Paenibacillus ferrarius]|uniref:3-oxoacyl-ACP reductase n=1 Tax=Paenibacillus ferrarius TaxID=1469647 RepID=A0A1V4HNB5_9BACL|nr:SDR family oxidoreductase [Paenibacillus ferrarius]OPH58988.1 3-oxoacyl-ACP reductase [Paenibacillus ferrarius]